MTSSRSHSRDDLFLTLTLLFEMGLICVTWPLWTEFRSFPAVPCFAILAGVPISVDRILLCVLLGANVFLVARGLWNQTTKVAGNESPSATVSNRDQRKTVFALGVSLVSAAALALLNQHRLQPWHWLFILVITQSLLVPMAERGRIHRLTIASIYVFAAISRLGPDVAGGMSRQVVSVIFKTAGIDELLRNGNLVFMACLAMTLTELAVGLLLIPERTRKLGVIGAVVVHLTLILVLSPLGLDHHWGVLVWNVYFVIAVPVLFRQADSAVMPAGSDRTSQAVSLPCRLFAVFVIIFPLSGLLGIADNWLSWQLYSPRPEVVRVFVRQDSVDVLPDEVRPFVGRPAPLDDWCPVRMDRWSLAATGAPIYPEDRFQLAVAAFLIAQNDSASIRIEIESPEVPAWWQRTTPERVVREDLQQRQHGHLLNAVKIRQAAR